MLILVVFDIIEVVGLVFLVIYIYVINDDFKTDTRHNRFITRRYIARLYCSVWAQGLLFFAKVALGIRWLCKRKRKYYIRYYRANMTYCLSMVMFMIGLMVMALWDKDYHHILIELGIITFSVAVMTISELHMRFLDDIHFANCDLAKDKQIIDQYRKTLER